MDFFDKKLTKLTSIGFTGDRIGMSDGRYTLTFVQIDELNSDEFNNFISDIIKIALKEHIKQDKDFVPYLDVIDEVIDSIDDIDLYKLDKEYLDISYVVLYKSIINLDEVYNLCKNYKL
jgi:hypothetical protein